ncbi:MAG: helix-turn-helix domain-containing protein [Thermoplasmata archaeon]|nr:helix-turn-helix domain-containing protein [Thermoplasmata archaeon]
MTPPLRFSLSGDESARLHAWSTDPANSPRSRTRARIVLLAAHGHSAAKIARTLGIRTETATLWIARFSMHRIDGLTKEAPRPRGSQAADATIRERILRTTHETRPPDPRGWTTRSLARYLGVSHMRVHRVWATHGVGEIPPAPPVGMPGAGYVPFVDVAGLFLEPPHRAAVFAVGVRWDSSVSATPVLAPSLPAARSGAFWTRPSSVGPEALLRALESPADAPRGMPGRSSSDLLIFLRRLEEQSPPSVQLHVVVEALGPTGARALRNWAERKVRFHLTEVASGETLAGQCRTFLQPWQTTRLHRGSFAHAVRALEVVGGRPGASGPSSRAFLWMPLTEPLLPMDRYAMTPAPTEPALPEPWLHPPLPGAFRSGAAPTDPTRRPPHPTAGPRPD